MTRRSAQLAMLCLALMSTTLAAACNWTWNPPHSRPECPHAWADYFNNASEQRPILTTGGAPPSSFLISGHITDVPEFHDCQRLISMQRDTATGVENMAYGELAALFVRDSLDFGVDAQTVAVVEVVSEGDYRPLGIRTGFNCLVIDKPARAARMVWMGTDGPAAKCRQLEGSPAPLPSGAVAFNLTYSMGPPLDKDSVPPVARWEWDPNRNQQLIGVKCTLNNWCTVGPTGFTGAVVNVVGKAPALMRVPGWYDEQYIAEYVTSTKGTNTVVPGNVFATAFPAPELARFKVMNDFDSRWQPAAFVALPDHFPTYRSKLGLVRAVATSALGNLNRVDLCLGDLKTCKVDKASISGPNSGCMNALLGKPIWARVIPPSGTDTVYHCVVYRPHTVVGFDIPAVVRWRWRPDDETLWIRCPAGCCEVHADDM